MEKTEKIKIQLTEPASRDFTCICFDESGRSFEQFAASAKALDQNDTREYEVMWSSYYQIEDDDGNWLESDAEVYKYCDDNGIDFEELIDWNTYNVRCDDKDVTDNVELVHNQYFE